MKLARYGELGQERPALVDRDGKLRDLSGFVPDIAGQHLLPASLDRLKALVPAALPLVPGDPRIGPCVGAVGKFVCVGLNYSDHAAESGLPVPTEPVLFMKALAS
jgi:2-keto-4-pentenoate hydratase/2-oxohepta-3-ene-1,7-dioic acid hydratase in catechol pathway